MASAFSLIDWSYEAIHNSTLRSFLETRTSEEAVMQSPLGSFFDMDRYRRIRTTFFNTAVSPASRSRSFVPIGMEIRRWMAQRPFLGDVAHALNNLAPKGMVGRPKERSHRATFRLLSRVAQATLFHDMLGRRSPWRFGPLSS